MSRLVVVCLCAIAIGVATFGVGIFRPAPAFAADAAVTIDAPLHESPDAGSAVLALLPEGAPVTIEGPPVDGFYPVSAAGLSGWLIGETLTVQKDVPSTEEMPAEDLASPDDAAAVPVEQTAMEPEHTEDAPTVTDPALAAPVSSPPLEGETASVAPDAAGVEAASTLVAEPSAPVGTEGSKVDPAAPAATPIPDPAMAAPTPEPTAAAVDAGPWGPASTLVNMPIRSGPGPEYGLIFTVPQGSAVEQTGQAANGYVSVRYKEVVGWASVTELGPPIAPASETLSETAGEPIDTKTPRPGSGVAYTTVDLSMRSEPSANSEPILSIPAGSRVVLTGVMEYEFQRIEFREQIGWVSNQFLTNPPSPEPSEERRAEYRTFSEQQIIKIIYAAADQYGQSRQDMLRVARCESNLDPYAVNPSGSYGLFQFIRSTWKSTPYGSADMFDPRANASAAAWMWSEGRKSEWVCQ